MLLDSTQLQNDGINIFLYFRLGFFYQKRAPSPYYLYSFVPFSSFFFLFFTGSHLNAVLFIFCTYQ